MKTPAELGYRLPAEWERQKRVWLAWPHQKADWPGKFAPIPLVFAEIARHICAQERLGLVCKDERAKAQAQDLLSKVGVNLKQVDFVVTPTNRGWMRDCGPIFVKNKGKIAGLGFGFNAWAKYPNWRHDTKLPATLAKQFKFPAFEPRHKGRHVVLEGGGIDVNGKGSILTTEEWLLTDVQVRNPGFTREDYEHIFADWLGAPNTIWLGHGIVGDDTHGHIDDLARFTAPDTVAIVVERNKRDENYGMLQDNLRRIKRARDERGKPLNVVELPMPKPLYFEDTRIPASYANFLIINGAVLMPTFNDPNDRIALNLLAECFPKREVIGIHAVDLVWGFGTIHCLTQQEPA